MEQVKNRVGIGNGQPRVDTPAFDKGEGPHASPGMKFFPNSGPHRTPEEIKRSLAEFEAKHPSFNFSNLPKPRKPGSNPPSSNGSQSGRSATNSTPDQNDPRKDNPLSQGPIHYR